MSAGIGHTQHEPGRHHCLEELTSPVDEEDRVLAGIEIHNTGAPVTAADEIVYARQR
ncbi:MAG TPA: hypothetical protein VF734_16795 [Pseudonocardiaceae bacterium]